MILAGERVWRLNPAVKKLNVSGIKPEFTINQETVRLSAARPLNLEWMRVVTENRPHDHDYYEICLVRRGRARHHTEDGEQELGPGTVMVVAPGGVHAFTRPKDLEVVNIYYLAEWLATGLREHWGERGLVPLFLAQALFRRPARPRPAVFQLTGTMTAAVEAELHDIRDELAAEQPSPLFMKAAFLKLLVRLSRACDQNGEDFSPAVWSVMQAIETCVENARPFDLGVLVRGWPVSADHGSRLFRRATGLSPLEYFQRRRIQHAGARLLDPERSITEVAMELGFADAAHFSRLFGKYAGLTPRAYREKYRVGR
jgi:AraC-like DNA-binding protein/mannose-6-phosphate isomerase-like protein (cupin superfamily)